MEWFAEGGDNLLKRGDKSIFSVTFQASGSGHKAVFKSKCQYSIINIRCGLFTDLHEVK